MDIIKLLRITFAALLLTAALLAIIFETAMLPAGQLADNPATVYALQITCVVLTVVCIPLSLKLLYFPRIRESFKDNEHRYLVWSMVRLAMQGTVLLLDLLMYYLLGFETTCAYLALMTVVAMLFTWPSRSKMEYECQLSYPRTEHS